MPINFHPTPGTILICDFQGFKEPEMVKRRPVVVISPRIRTRGNLCSIVPFSTSPPYPSELHHFKLRTIPTLPKPYDAEEHWIKCDMVYTVSHARLYVMAKEDRDIYNKVQYDQRVISNEDLQKIQACVLHGLGFSGLTQHWPIA